MTELLAKYGSFRRITQAYWEGLMGIEEERALENAMPKHLLIGYKPTETTDEISKVTPR